MSIPEEVGRNISFLRKLAGVSMEWVCLEANISFSYLYMIEHGKTNPTIEILSKIANVLDVPFELLFDSNLIDNYAQLMAECTEEEQPLTLREVVFLRSALASFRKQQKEE